MSFQTERFTYYFYLLLINRKYMFFYTFGVNLTLDERLISVLFRVMKYKPGIYQQIMRTIAQKGGFPMQIMLYTIISYIIRCKLNKNE